MIESKETVNVYYNNKTNIIKIKLDEKIRTIYNNSEMDITVVEIILEDEIDKNYFLSANLNNLDINYIFNKDIYIIQDSEYGNFNYSEGKNLDVNN